MKSIYKYLITLGIGLLVAFMIAAFDNIFYVRTANEAYLILIDAFFVPGILLVCFGGLVIASNGGTFDMIFFGVGKFFSLFKRDVQNVKYKTFRDYRMARDRNNDSYAFLLVAGLILVAISGVFIALAWDPSWANRT